MGFCENSDKPSDSIIIEGRAYNMEIFIYLFIL
jgi:hypothetical protein